MADMVGRKYMDRKTKLVYTVTRYDEAQKVVHLESPSGTRAEVEMANMVYGWDRVFS